MNNIGCIENGVELKVRQINNIMQLIDRAEELLALRNSKGPNEMDG